jgi:uncharacterized metal-binding protein YceD (DUF177 family)
MRKVHGEEPATGSSCDPDMLKRLYEHPHEDLIDPRWEALKKLKENK